MTNALLRYLYVAGLALAAACAHASVGVTRLPGLDGDGPITLFYPSSQADATTERGPYRLQLAAEGPPVRGNGRLVVLSHGSGGAPWPQTDLARTLVLAGFTVALPEHQGDNYEDMADAGPASWKRRWRLDDPRWYTHHDPRIQAVVAEVPFAADFDLQSLAQPRVALGIVQAGQDRWLAPRFHSGPVLASCKTCELVADLPTAGHGALLSPKPPRWAASVEALMQEPSAFDAALVPVTHARIAAFMRRHLLP